MKRGFFAWLFRRRRRDDFEPTLAHALAATAGGALFRAMQREMSVQAAPVGLDEMKEQVQVRSPGWCASYFTDSDTPDLTLIIPDSWASGMASASPGPPEKGVPAPVTAVCADAADFLRFDAPVTPHRFLRRYEAGDLPLLEWRTSGMQAFRLAAGDADGPSFFACVQEDRATAFVDSLREQRRMRGVPRRDKRMRGVPRRKERQEALRAFLAACREPAAGAGRLPPSRELLVRAPRELVLGGLFLPPRIDCGTRIAEVMCTGLSAGPDPSILDAAGVWAATGCDTGAAGQGTRLTLWYFLPAPDSQHAAKMRETFRGLAGCIFRAAMPRLAEALGTRLSNPGLSLDAKPDPGRSGLLCIHGRIRLADVRMRVQAFVESSTLAALLRRNCSPVALAATTGASRSALSLALVLNEELLARSLGSFTRSFLDPRLGGDFFPFSAFVDLVTDRDLALVMQNHLPRALGGRPPRRLVAWSDGGTRVVTPLFFGEERLLRFLTPQGRDAWERTTAEELGSREEYLDLNRAVLSGIARAARKGTLLLSPRARGILSRMALPGIQERTRQKLREAIASGEPFGALRAMSRPLVQRLFSTQPDRVICLALVGSERELAFVRANVSAARRARLEEDFAQVRTLLTDGVIDPEEAVQARGSLGAAARQMREEQAGRAEKGRGRSRNAPPSLSE